MLPSSGYFQTINCPFYDSGLCDRPYCHYRHVKKEVSLQKDSAGTVNRLNTEPASALLTIADDQNILQQLVSEAVKKALQDTELSSSAEGELATSQSSGNNSEVSSKLVEKVIEGLKPLVTPPAATSATIPSYKPTPISELRKRHIPVPYTPKDTKTIQVKRQLTCDGSSQFLKVKSTSSKHREEYVPGISGKAIGSDIPVYKPFASQNYGEVQYSPSDTRVKSEILYTPSDKSSLPSKAADYVPTGLSDNYIPDSLYKPTTRGDSPIQEPEYQPDVGRGSATNVSYTPSKLDCLEEVSDCLETVDVIRTISITGLSSTSSENRTEKDPVKKNVKQTSKTSDRKSETRGKLDPSSEGEQHKSSSKYSELVNGVCDVTLKRYSKEKDNIKTSQTKHSSHHREQKDCKERKDSKIRKESKEHKDSKDHKTSKDCKEQRDLKGREDKRDSKHSKDPKNNKDLKDKVHKNIKDSKELAKKRKRKDSDDQHKKSKDRHPDVKEGCESDRKDKSRDSCRSVESKHRTEGSHKIHKDGKSREEKNQSSRSGLHSVDKTKTKHKSDSHHSSREKDYEPASKKVKIDMSNNNNRHSDKKSNMVGLKSDTKIKHKNEDSFEEMECLLKETIIDTEANEYGSFDDSDTDEDVREQECLRIFNSYKPDDALTSQDKQKKGKLEGNEETPVVATASRKRRLAHEGATQLTRKPSLPNKTMVNPAQAMIKRFAKLREEQEKVAHNSNVLSHQQPVHQKPTIGSGKIRIAHVPNVSKLLDAKKNLSASVQGAKTEPTVSQTLPKGLQRVAHVPPVVITRRPFICPDSHTKIPTNVRQKYLNLIFEELYKKLGETEECCKKSLYEEQCCYKRSSTRNVYVNLAIITIQRLRNMDVTEAAKDDFSGGSKPTLLHEDVIGGKAKAKGLWSIIPPKRAPVSIDENTAYQMMIEKYVLTEDELTQNGYPRPHPTEKGRAVMIETIYRSRTKSKNYFERVCDRCGKEYVVDEKGLSRSEEQCVYHWGRPFKKRGIGGLETQYSCCQGEARAEGCSVWNCHISDMFDPDNQKGFVQMLEKHDSSTDQIYALDCEMCYTTDGMDLLRVTVINFNGETVYDTLVKPEKTVLDYATRFSGISEEDMKNVTKTLLDVQATLLSLFNKKTILIGHSLDSDLKALKLIHDTVVDTSMVFPHRRGPPYKRALKTLSAEYLQKIIQSGEGGHDSAEDALACIELMKWKLKDDLKSK